MMVFACISPHPPIILPSVGSEEDRKKVKKTITSLEKLGKQLAKVKPDCLVISSPHPDWGINVPLYFLSSKLKMKNEKLQFKIQNYSYPNYKLPITNFYPTVYPVLTTLDSPRQHFDWGKRIIKSLPRAKRGAWIASGDMSHCLKEDGPYGFNPAGPVFDKKFMELLKKKDIPGILNLDSELVEGAGECGLRSFCMLLGALEASRITWEPKILSYEYPFGVGYLVADIRINPNPYPNKPK
ncbi:MAG: hypothetical protein ACOZBZ_04965 [Patescibacteria group bacterium]